MWCWPALCVYDVCAYVSPRGYLVPDVSAAHLDATLFNVNNPISQREHATGDTCRPHNHFLDSQRTLHQRYARLSCLWHRAEEPEGGPQASASATLNSRLRQLFHGDVVTKSSDPSYRGKVVVGTA